MIKNGLRLKYWYGHEQSMPQTLAVVKMTFFILMPNICKQKSWQHKKAITRLKTYGRIHLYG